MLLRFIGTDGSMGLKRGNIYNCSIATRGNDIWVSWSWLCECPYSSISALAANWETF